jgi:hypothetical protein
VFDSLTIHGGAGSVMWGYRVAVELKTWRIVRAKADGGQWMLSATIARIDKFQSRQAPLLFTAPRAGGFWAWPIDAIEIGETSLRATLGPPER